MQGAEQAGQQNGLKITTVRSVDWKVYKKLFGDPNKEQSIQQMEIQEPAKVLEVPEIDSIESQSKEATSDKEITINKTDWTITKEG